MRKKNTRTWLWLVLLIGLLGLGGYFANRWYERTQQELLIQQARTALAASDFRNAALCLNQALKHNPKDVIACRLMAQLTEMRGSASALTWRKRVVEFNPGSLDDRLALVKTAMMARDFETASKTLDGVDAAGKNTAAYQGEAGAVDVAMSKFSEAEAHFQEAARLEPTNLTPLVNIAVLRLAKTNETELAEGRAFLRSLSTNPTNSFLRRKALLELTADAKRYHQTNSAVDLTKALLQETNSVFEDKILRLDALAEAGSSEVKPTLESAQREAGGDPAKVYQLASWEAKTRPPAEVLAWLQTLPVTTQTNRLMVLVMAEAYCDAGDWKGLQSFIKPQKWTDFECARYAFQARALQGQNLPDEAKAKWAEALEEASGRKQNLIMLLRLATKWHWSTERENILRFLINKNPNEKWALQELSQMFYDSGRTWPLLELFTEASKRDPSDVMLKNNIAWIALLVNGEGWKPHDLAREVYEKSPTNAHFASTYAFSLHLQNKDAEALKVLESLKPAELENPSIAGGYGLVLQATGNRAKARKYLEIGSKAPMLPEQKKLLEAAGAER